MCKSDDCRNYLKGIEATYRARCLEHTNTTLAHVTYVSSEHPAEMSESHNPLEHRIVFCTGPESSRFYL
jgi:hypothetical protein